MSNLDTENFVNLQILNDVKIHVNNGNRYFHNGEYLEAIAEYNIALLSDSYNPNILYNKGVALMKLRRHNEATACFDKVMEIHPNYFDDFNKKKVDNNLLENCA